MKKGQYLDELLRSVKTVFSIDDIALLWREDNRAVIRNRLHYYLKNKQLIHLRQGIYAKDTKYEKFELAIKILKPSYISFETVLAKAGLIFQYYSNITLASYLTRELTCDGTVYTFKKIKTDVLTNPYGIEQKDEYAIASVERAVLDTIYLNKKFYFDNLSGINWEKINAMVGIYGNKQMIKTLNELYRQYKAENR